MARRIHALSIMTGCASILVLATRIASAQDASTASVSPPISAVGPMDGLKDVIDPFHEGQQRARFLRASRVDGEMSEAQFLADQKRDDGFIRAFDRWTILMHFDVNRNKTIDWLEAREYRRAILSILLAKFDTNKNGRLNDQERVAANRLLANNELDALFASSCCGGQRYVRPNNETARQQLLESLEIEKMSGPERMRANYERLKQLALEHPKIIDGFPEEKFLPMITAPSDGEIEGLLRPVYERALAEHMGTEHWAGFRELVYATLRWNCDADPKALVVTLTTLNRYMNDGPPVRDDFRPEDHPEWMAQVHGRMMAVGPSFRTGFSHDAVKILKQLEFPDSAPPKLVKFVREELDKGAMIIEVNLLSRTPSSPLGYLGSERIESIPDHYERRIGHWLYNPVRKYPFMYIGEHSRPLPDGAIKEEALSR